MSLVNSEHLDGGLNETRRPDRFRPMLATRYRSFAPGFAQAKLDGVRCIARASGLFTRTGNFITGVPHVREQLKSFFQANPDAILDGELYHHSLRNDFEAIVRKVRDPKPDFSCRTPPIQYHVYDMPSDLNFSLRSRMLSARLEPGDAIILVKTRVVSSEADYDRLHSRWLNLGYEGSMWRADVPYQQGRSSALQKRKAQKDREFVCLAIEPGTAAFADKAKRVLCALPDGRTFRANVGATHARARELLNERHNVVTVRFQDFTSSGIPRFPVAVKFWGHARDI
jgi:DNA ligase-1